MEPQVHRKAPGAPPLPSTAAVTAVKSQDSSGAPRQPLVLTPSVQTAKDSCLSLPSHRKWVGHQGQRDVRGHCGVAVQLSG